MRRPAVDPEMRGQVVSQRNMMQGMAGGRVPSAYPVPRQRIPRIMGGAGGREPLSPAFAGQMDCGGTTASPSTAVDVFAGYSEVWNLDDGYYRTPEAGDRLVAVTRHLGTLTTPAGWTVLEEGTQGDMTYRVCTAIYGEPGLGHTWGNPGYLAELGLWVFRGAATPPTVVVGGSGTDSGPMTMLDGDGYSHFVAVVTAMMPPYEAPNLLVPAVLWAPDYPSSDYGTPVAYDFSTTGTRGRDAESAIQWRADLPLTAAQSVEGTQIPSAFFPNVARPWGDWVSLGFGWA